MQASYVREKLWSRRLDVTQNVQLSKSYGKRYGQFARMQILFETVESAINPPNP